ncbi:MAG: sulfotransferase [Acidimicrobiales bacterium]
MKVIGSGFGRTGTLSMKHALEDLGVGPCYHMEEVPRHRGHVGVWHAAGRGEPVDWSRLFAGFESAVDFPASVVYRDLMEAFPDAKVVHTVRDPDRWYESTFETIYQARTLAPAWVLRSVPAARRFFEMVEMLVWDGVFDGRFTDREFALRRYREWTAEVIATVSPERLLVFDVRDGWEPLCAFLDLPVPAHDFPNVNDRESMLRRFRVIRTATRAAPFVGAALVAGVSRLGRRAVSTSSCRRAR